MKFNPPLFSGKLVKRYKRFLADVEMPDGDIVTVHCANSGSMSGLKTPGATVWMSRSNNPKRKLACSWELIDVGTSLVGVNTAHPNRLVEQAVSDQKIPELTGYETIRREVKYGTNSRIDLLLQQPQQPDCYVEIKSVTLKRESAFAEFPDAVTARGTKHLNELSAMVAAGSRAVMFYLIQRNDCNGMKIAGDIDPDYLTAFYAAKSAGVEVICYDCQLSPDFIKINRQQSFFDW